MELNVIFNKIENLIANQMFSSARLTTSFLISHLESSSELAIPQLTKQLTQAYYLYGEIFFGLEEYKRASKYFQLSLDKLIFGKQANAELEIQIRYLCSRCYYKTKEYQLAKQLLEGIPDKLRPAKVNLLLGSVYQEMDIESSLIIQCYKAVVREQPNCYEAIEALLKIGYPAKEIYRMLTLNDDPWLFQWLEAKMLSEAYEYEKSSELISKLSAKYVGNLELLLFQAETCYQGGKVTQAIKAFQNIRNLDPYEFRKMDSYAALLKSVGKIDELNKLSGDLISIAPTRVESWLALSKYCDAKDEKEKSTAFIERAIQMAPRHQQCFIFKGNHLISEKSNEAIVCFRKAYNIKKDLASFQGLVESYLAVNRIKDALSIAKEALQLMPRNPKALILVGIVLSHTPDGKEKAKKAFENALIVDPSCSEAVIAIFSLVVSNNLSLQNWKDSIDLLERHLAVDATDFLHTRLADIYTLANDFSKAISHYNAALSINPDYERANEGMARVEKLLTRNQESQDQSMIDATMRNS